MAALDNLSGRERSLAVGFGATIVLLIVILVPFRVSAYLSDKQKANDDLRQVIQTVDLARVKLAQRRAELGDVAARYINKAPPLGVLIDTAAKGAGLEIALQQDIPPVPRGKLYSERAAKITVQKTGLKAISMFLEKLEAGKHPVAVTQFDMAKRIEADSFAVTMTITAWDRTEAPVSPAPSASSTGLRR